MAGNKILEVIRKTSQENKSDLTDLLFGQVTSVSPLRIKIENRYEISDDLIILTSAVQDFEVEMTVDHETETASSHIHKYKGKKKFFVHLALKVGEKVLVLRVQNGQKFVIIDRLR